MVICEGETEKRYFSAIKDRLKANGIEVYQPPESNPGGMIECAEKRLRDARHRGLGIEAWLVFDAEDAEREAERGYREAIQRAQRKGFKLANSSPNFEYWALTHYQPGSMVYTTREAEARLSSACGGYEKPDLPFDDLWERYESRVPSDAAASRRDAASELGENPRFARPVTYVDELVDMLVEAFGQHR